MSPPLARNLVPPPWGQIVRDPAFLVGVREMAPMSIGIGAWGLVTGVAMTKSGLPPLLAVFMSLMVFAGSAQLAVLPLIIAGSPIWVVWLTAACVNLRFVIFSTIWRNYFGQFKRSYRCLLGYMSGDVTFVLFLQRYPKPHPAPEQLPYFWGASGINWCAWQGMSILGIVLANAIPQHWGLGFAGVLALLGVLCSMLGDRISWVAAGVSVMATVAAFALPLKLNILVAIAAAVTVGLVVEAAWPLKPVQPLNPPKEPTR